MKKRFILLFDGATKEQEDALLEWIRASAFGWWHWFPNSWLMTDYAGSIDATAIRDKLKEFFPGKNNLVIEIHGEDNTWAGFGPTADNKNMFTWLHETWTKCHD